MFKRMSIKNKTIFGIVLILVGLCFSVIWIFYPGEIFSLISLLTGLCLISTGALMLDNVRNERYKIKYGRELYPKIDKKIVAEMAVIYVLVRISIGLIIFVIASYFVFR